MQAERKIYLEKNKDKIAEQQKQYEIEHKNRLDIYRKEYREKNKDNIAVALTYLA